MERKAVKHLFSFRHWPENFHSLCLNSWSNPTLMPDEETQTWRVRWLSLHNRNKTESAWESSLVLLQMSFYESSSNIWKCSTAPPDRREMLRSVTLLSRPEAPARRHGQVPLDLDSSSCSKRSPPDASACMSVLGVLPFGLVSMPLVLKERGSSSPHHRKEVYISTTFPRVSATKKLVQSQISTVPRWQRPIQNDNVSQ